MLLKMRPYLSRYLCGKHVISNGFVYEFLGLPSTPVPGETLSQYRPSNTADGPSIYHARGRQRLLITTNGCLQFDLTTALNQPLYMQINHPSLYLDTDTSLPQILLTKTQLELDMTSQTAISDVVR